MKLSNGERLRHVGTEVPNDVHRKLTVRAAKTGRSAAQLIRDLIERELNREPK